MYFNIEYWLIMIRRIWRKKGAKGRGKLLFRLLVLVPLTYLFHSLFFFLDKILFPGLWAQKIEKPVFIVGHARSGTTLMHRLMAADEGRYNYFLYWEMFFPSLIQKKIIRFLGKVDRAVLGEFFYKKLKAWDDKTFGPVRHIHNMSLWIPEEDDFVNNSTFFAAYWHLQAPLMDTMDVFYLDRQSPARRRRVMNHWKECIRRQIYLNGGDLTHLSKNPVYSGRVASLIEAFPDARIVVMVRNPFECVPSNLKLMEGNYMGKGWSKADYAESLKVLEEQSYDCYRMPREVLQANPDVPQIVVDYRKLVAEPKQTVEQIYGALGIEMSDAYRQEMDSRGQRAKKHKTKHSYSAEEFGMDIERMQSELADFFEEYRWLDEMEIK
jgi:hypothetical protein